MGITGLLLALVATQATDAVILSNDPAEAAKTCAWDATGGEWRCDKRRLERFRLVGVTTQEGTTPATVTVSPMSDGTCLRALVVEVSGHPADLMVDWSRVALAVNGVAVQAVPGFARKLTSSLAQRPSIAPTGTALREQVFPVDADCIGEKRPPYDAQSTLELHMPHTIGGEEATFQWRMAREWVPVTEREAFGLLPPPGGARVATGFAPPLTICVSLWGPAACGLLGVGTLSAATVVELVSLSLVSSGQRTTWTEGACLGGAACGALLLCVPAFYCALGGVVVDVFWGLIAMGTRASHNFRQGEARR